MMGGTNRFFTVVMLRSLKGFLLVLALVTLGATTFLGGRLGLIGASNASAENAASASNYPQVGIRTGVYNDGQAALWDLNLFDHFHYFGPDTRARGYKPQQPINFSHVIHVQQNKIECQYCHWTVAKSGYAAIPEVETCMTCHKVIKGKDDAAKAEIAKIGAAYSAGKPIEWTKVHVMPDYVKFNHKRHLKGGVACQECHGQIPEMDVVERVSSMKMGWCIDCHRERGASIDCSTCHR